MFGSPLEEKLWEILDHGPVEVKIFLLESASYAKFGLGNGP